MFGVFSSRLGRFAITCTQNAYFLQKVDFCIFKPQNREVIENSLTMHILGQKFISISLGFSQKKDIEKWLLRTSV